MTHPIARRIVGRNQPQTLHHDAVREGRAAIMPGQWARHDPFLSMMNDRFKPGAFGPHPHRGFETVTYVLSGSLKHQDSKGGSGLLHAGDVQWMTAGAGVIHNEIPADDGVHVLQLWVNLPAEHKLAPFRYQDLRGESVPQFEHEGAHVKVFAGESGGISGAAQTFSPLTMLEITLQPGSSYTHRLNPDDNGFIYVIQGSGRFGADETFGERDDTLWMAHQADQAGEITVLADSPLKILLLCGRPLREPVIAYGPFVMNSEQQIVEAVADYRSGKFGSIS